VKKKPKTKSLFGNKYLLPKSYGFAPYLGSQESFESQKASPLGWNKFNKAFMPKKLNEY